MEAWIRRSSTSVVSTGPGVAGLVLGFGINGYGFGLDGSGQPILTKIGSSSVGAGIFITDLNWHHIAVTKQGSTAVFYIDGTAYPSSYSTTFSFPSGAAAVGARGDNLGNSFLGSIDELSIYNRALSAIEVQSIYSAGSFGKCHPTGPAITLQPISQSVALSSNATLSAAAAGTQPLSYQWFKEYFPLAAKTDSSLLFPAIQQGDFGSYTAQITNRWGAVTSSVAVLYLKPDFGSMSIARSSDGTALLALTGVQGTNYRIQYKDDLSGPWLDLTNGTADQFGLFQAFDSPTNGSARFYRSVTP